MSSLTHPLFTPEREAELDRELDALRGMLASKIGELMALQQLGVRSIPMEDALRLGLVKVRH